MAGRPLKERLRCDLDTVRRELMTEAARIRLQDLDWRPQPGMKSCRDLLREIGTMEKLCVAWVSERAELSWDDAIAWSGEDLGSTLTDLVRVREETLVFLKSATEDTLQAPQPALWGSIPHGPLAEPEEVLRWIARHEYYHLGQIVTYRWILGDNPYAR